MGWASSSIDELGNETFRKVRRELGPGGMLHVESTTARRVTNPGPDELVMLVVGAKEGYVGRDGQPAAPKAFLRDVDAD